MPEQQRFRNRTFKHNAACLEAHLDTPGMDNREKPVPQCLERPREGDSVDVGGT